MSGLALTRDVGIVSRTRSGAVPEPGQRDGVAETKGTLHAIDAPIGAGRRKNHNERNQREDFSSPLSNVLYGKIALPSRTS
jgi:hypothetical protein